MRLAVVVAFSLWGLTLVRLAYWQRRRAPVLTDRLVSAAVLALVLAV